MTVHFIGAGPGAADLITVRGRNLIARCPVCLYAGSIVPRELLGFCPPGARIVDTAPLSLDQIEALFASIREKHRRLDVLVNNAAANPYFGSILATDPVAFQKTVDVNIRGYFFMSTHGAKLMVENGGGSIINVASVNGVNPGHFQGIYSITKAAVISMTKAFAVECAEAGIRCNALLPGLTDTKFASVLVNTPAILNRALARIPMRRVGQPSEMAGLVLYLASAASTYTTGAVVNVDGGYLSA